MLADSVTMPSTNISNQAVKRRACDECRNRKLACSKEPSGCFRCIREKIVCNYSEQKPMGRPRKRPRSDNETDCAEEMDPYLPELESLPYFDDNLIIDPYFQYGSEHLVVDGTDDTATSSGLKDVQSLMTVSDEGMIWQSGTGSLDENKSSVNSDKDLGIIDPFLQDTLAGNQDATAHQYHHAPRNPVCGCLATMYLAMASLQELPTEIKSAIVTVRVASNTAQAVLRCDKCGILPVVDMHPSIEVFQNTMLLGTIIPTVVDGYKKISQMLNCETRHATALGAKKIFRLADYGHIQGIEYLSREFEALESIPLEPLEWNSAMHRLLKAEVYGHGNENTGLKGIIAEMENRQRSRHRELDRLRAAGLLVIIEERMCVSEKDALCLRILDAAKISLDCLDLD